MGLVLAVVYWAPCCTIYESDEMRTDSQLNGLFRFQKTLSYLYTHLYIYSYNTYTHTYNSSHLLI
jgi:hypothetical protein